MIRTIICVSILFKFFLLMKVQCQLPVIRQSHNGPVEGIEQTSALNQRYYSFRGIPYAEPPITGIDPYTGEKVDRRFKEPEALKRKWAVPLKAHDYAKSCVPSNMSSRPYPELPSEDCLFLNIFVPVGGARLKTTMIFIHGGGFWSGDPTDHTFGPDFLLSQDNILVTFGYRLGIFGFLNLGYGDYTGNMGLKDQQLAIKWIYENIEQFSGNRREILLFGQSAGGSSVQFHMVNEESRKYFSRAFSISGSAFETYALRTGDHIDYIQNCTGINEIGQMIEYLKTANTSILSDYYVPGERKDKPYYSIWVPYIERPDSKRPFLNRKLYDIYNSDKAPVMDTMFSFASQEAVQFRPKSLNKTEPLLSEDWEKTDFRIIIRNFTPEAHPKEYKWAVKKLIDAYFSNATSVEAIKRANIDLQSDTLLVDPIIKSIALQANANKRGANERHHKKTFLYRFAIHADLNLYQLLSRSIYKEATHMDEHCYFFYCRSLDPLKLYDKPLRNKDINYDIIVRLVKMITNFARTGDPSIEGDTPFKSCRSPNEIYCQEVSNEPKTYVTNDIKEQRQYELWREIEKVALELNGNTGSKTNRLGQGTLFIFASFHLLLFILMKKSCSFC